MKVFFSFLFLGVAVIASAQNKVSMTFTIDMMPYVQAQTNNNFTLHSKGLSIAGNFHSCGNDTLVDWTPSDGNFKRVGSSDTYKITMFGLIPYDTLLFTLAVGNTDWMNVVANESDKSTTALTSDCALNDGNGWMNRRVVIPPYNSAYTGKWNTCGDIQCPYSLSITHNDSHCADSSGSVNLNSSGFTSSAVFLWNNGATTQNLSHLGQGNYAVTVTDLACTQTLSATIINVDGPTISTDVTNILCSYGGVGKITAHATGGTPPYSYEWNNVPGDSTFPNLPTGIYHLVVTDNGGCQTETTDTVFFRPASKLSSFVSTTPENCNRTNGEITLSVKGGTPPYTYVWTNGGTTKNQSNLEAGPYEVTITDVNSCTATAPANVKAACENYIRGTIYFDKNNNCVADSNESVLNGALVLAESSAGAYFANANTDGRFNIPISINGTFTVSYINVAHAACLDYHMCNNPTGTITFDTLGTNIMNQDIAVSNSSGKADLAMNIHYTEAKPGFDKTYSIYPYNKNYEDFNLPASIVFEFDPALEYENSTPPAIYDSATHTLTWTTNYIPADYHNSSYIANFKVPASLPIDKDLVNYFTILPMQDDCDTISNHVRVASTVLSSHDPNEKEVQPSGNITENDSVLTYTIHFQNTGNAPTDFIIVKDTLSPFLDPSTLQTIASSHEYSEFDISGKGTATWTFNPLILADSTSDFAGSKGFVTYSIKKLKNLPENTVIENKASIYFDYNTPVITNTATSAIKNISTGNILPQNNKGISIYPNPTKDIAVISIKTSDKILKITVSDLLGKELQSDSYDANRSTATVKLPASQGLYFITVTGKERSYAGKVIKE